MTISQKKKSRPSASPLKKGTDSLEKPPRKSAGKVSNDDLLGLDDENEQAFNDAQDRVDFFEEEEEEEQPETPQA